MFYFNDNIPLEALLREQGALQPSAFIPVWKSLPDANEAVQNLQSQINTPDAAIQRLQTLNLVLQVWLLVCGGELSGHWEEKKAGMLLHEQLKLGRSRSRRT